MTTNISYWILETKENIISILILCIKLGMPASSTMKAGVSWMKKNSYYARK